MSRGGRRRYCPTKKFKIFNEAWALLKCEELGARDGDVHKPYRCVCGWWHTLNLSKRRRKDNNGGRLWYQGAVWENEGGALDKRNRWT